MVQLDVFKMTNQVPILRYRLLPLLQLEHLQSLLLLQPQQLLHLILSVRQI